MIVTKNPYTQEELNKYQYLSDKELNDILIAGQSTYNRWKRESLEARIKYIQSVFTNLSTNVDFYAQLITSEMGKPIHESKAEIDKCLWLCNYYVEIAPDLVLEQEEILTNKRVIHTLAPTGSVLGIMPWNYPFWQVFRYAIPNLLAGHTILLKHAPNTTGCGLALEELFSKNAPFANLFRTLVIDIPQIEHVIAHKSVQGVCLTGSLAAGKAVGALAGKYIKPSILELGSSDALAILESSDLDEGLDAAFNSRMINAGQTCIAAKRIFVSKESYDYTLDYLRNLVNGIKVGDPTHHATDIGPIAKESFVTDLVQQVEQAKKYGSRVYYGASYEGNFFLPGIMASDFSNPINNEEIFGPILNVIPYTNENQLQEMINSSDFGLSASLWCNDEEKAIRLARQIDVGTVVINDFMKSDPRIPFGGTKLSGYGREMGKEGFRTFQNKKVIITANN